MVALLLKLSWILFVLYMSVNCELHNEVAQSFLKSVGNESSSVTSSEENRIFNSGTSLEEALIGVGNQSPFNSNSDLDAVMEGEPRFTRSPARGVSQKFESKCINEGNISDIESLFSSGCEESSNRDASDSLYSQLIKLNEEALISKRGSLNGVDTNAKDIRDVLNTSDCYRREERRIPKSKLKDRKMTELQDIKEKQAGDERSRARGDGDSTLAFTTPKPLQENYVSKFNRTHNRRYPNIRLKKIKGMHVRKEKREVQYSQGSLDDTEELAPPREAVSERFRLVTITEDQGRGKELQPHEESYSDTNERQAQSNEKLSSSLQSVARFNLGRKETLSDQSDVTTVTTEDKLKDPQVLTTKNHKSDQMYKENWRGKSKINKDKIKSAQLSRYKDERGKEKPHTFHVIHQTEDNSHSTLINFKTYKVGKKAQEKGSTEEVEQINRSQETTKANSIVTKSVNIQTGNVNLTDQDKHKNQMESRKHPGDSLSRTKEITNKTLKYSKDSKSESFTDQIKYKSQLDSRKHSGMKDAVNKTLNNLKDQNINTNLHDHGKGRKSQQSRKYGDHSSDIKVEGDKSLKNLSEKSKKVGLTKSKSRNQFEGKKSSTENLPSINDVGDKTHKNIHVKDKNVDLKNQNKSLKQAGGRKYSEEKLSGAKSLRNETVINLNEQNSSEVIPDHIASRNQSDNKKYHGEDLSRFKDTGNKTSKFNDQFRNANLAGHTKMKNKLENGESGENGKSSDNKHIIIGETKVKVEQVKKISPVKALKHKDHKNYSSANANSRNYVSKTPQATFYTSTQKTEDVTSHAHLLDQNSASNTEFEKDKNELSMKETESKTNGKSRKEKEKENDTEFDKESKTKLSKETQIESKSKYSKEAQDKSKCKDRKEEEEEEEDESSSIKNAKELKKSEKKLSKQERNKTETIPLVGHSKLKNKLESGEIGESGKMPDYKHVNVGESKVKSQQNKQIFPVKEVKHNEHRNNNSANTNGEDYANKAPQAPYKYTHGSRNISYDALAPDHNTASNNMELKNDKTKQSAKESESKTNGKSKKEKEKYKEKEKETDIESDKEVKVKSSKGTQVESKTKSSKETQPESKIKASKETDRSKAKDKKEEEEEEEDDSSSKTSKEPKKLEKTSSKDEVNDTETDTKPYKKQKEKARKEDNREEARKEEKNTMKEEKNTVKEEKNTVKEEKNNVKEEKNNVKEEKNTVKGKKKEEEEIKKNGVKSEKGKEKGETSEDKFEPKKSSKEEVSQKSEKGSEKGSKSPKGKSMNEKSYHSNAIPVHQHRFSNASHHRELENNQSTHSTHSMDEVNSEQQNNEIKYQELKGDRKLKDWGPKPTTFQSDNILAEEDKSNEYKQSDYGADFRNNQSMGENNGQENIQEISRVPENKVSVGVVQTTQSATRQEHDQDGSDTSKYASRTQINHGVEIHQGSNISISEFHESNYEKIKQQQTSESQYLERVQSNHSAKNLSERLFNHSTGYSIPAQKSVYANNEQVSGEKSGANLDKDKKGSDNNSPERNEEETILDNEVGSENLVGKPHIKSTSLKYLENTSEYNDKLACTISTMQETLPALQSGVEHDSDNNVTENSERFGQIVVGNFSMEYTTPRVEINVNDPSLRGTIQIPLSTQCFAGFRSTFRNQMLPLPAETMQNLSNQVETIKIQQDHIIPRQRNDKGKINPNSPSIMRNYTSGHKENLLHSTNSLIQFSKQFYNITGDRKRTMLKHIAVDTNDEDNDLLEEGYKRKTRQLQGDNEWQGQLSPEIHDLDSLSLIQKNTVSSKRKSNDDDDDYNFSEPKQLQYVRNYRIQKKLKFDPLDKRPKQHHREKEKSKYKYTSYEDYLKKNLGPDRRLEPKHSNIPKKEKEKMKDYAVVTKEDYANLLHHLLVGMNKGIETTSSGLIPGEEEEEENVTDELEKYTKIPTHKIGKGGKVSPVFQEVLMPEKAGRMQNTEIAQEKKIGRIKPHKLVPSEKELKLPPYKPSYALRNGPMHKKKNRKYINRNKVHRHFGKLKPSNKIYIMDQDEDVLGNDVVSAISKNELWSYKEANEGDDEKYKELINDACEKDEDKCESEENEFRTEYLKNFVLVSHKQVEEEEECVTKLETGTELVAGFCGATRVHAMERLVNVFIKASAALKAQESCLVELTSGAMIAAENHCRDIKEIVDILGKSVQEHLEQKCRLKDLGLRLLLVTQVLDSKCEDEKCKSSSKSPKNCSLDEDLAKWRLMMNENNKELNMEDIKRIYESQYAIGSKQGHLNQRAIIQERRVGSSQEGDNNNCGTSGSQRWIKAMKAIHKKCPNIVLKPCCLP